MANKFIYTNHNKTTKSKTMARKTKGFKFLRNDCARITAGQCATQRFLFVKAGPIVLKWSELDSCSECLQILAKSACHATVYKWKNFVYKFLPVRKS